MRNLKQNKEETELKNFIESVIMRLRNIKKEIDQSMYKDLNKAMDKVEQVCEFGKLNVWGSVTEEE